MPPASLPMAASFCASRRSAFAPAKRGLRFPDQFFPRTRKLLAQDNGPPIVEAMEGGDGRLGAKGLVPIRLQESRPETADEHARCLVPVGKGKPTSRIPVGARPLVGLVRAPVTLLYRSTQMFTHCGRRGRHRLARERT